MKKLFFCISSFFLIFAIFSCTNADSAKTNSNGIPGEETIDISTADSLFSLQDSIGFENDADNGNAAPGENNSHSGPVLDSTDKQLEYMKESENWDKYESGILPTMAEEVPEYCQEILEKDANRFIIVDKAKMKVFLYDKYGNVEKSYGIACAKNYGTKKKKGDSRTTEGIFEVKGVFDSTEWLFTNDAGYTSPQKGQYGPRFIRLSIPYIGIHGTGSPRSIGKRCSHGCIRVTNDNIMELVDYVETGMPVIISPGPKDMAVNEKEGSDIPSVSTEPGSPRATASSSSRTNQAKTSNSEKAVTEGNETSEKADSESSASSDPSIEGQPVSSTPESSQTEITPSSNQPEIKSSEEQN